MKGTNYVDTTYQPTNELTHISLCAGYGGIDLGLHRIFGQKLRTVAYSEIEAFAVENLLAKMESGLLPAAPVWTDLRTFPWADFQGIDILTGGFPCQPFSAAGKRDADSDPRHLFPAILEGIRHAKPRLVFLENVQGIIYAKLAGNGWRDPAGTPVLLHVLRELERVGYRATAGIFDAATEGAPHQRKRVFILAHCNDEGLQGHRRYVAEHDAQRWQEQAGHAWPSRPGEPQHGWEPPRVVGNSSTTRWTQYCAGLNESQNDSSTTYADEDCGQTQPPLGRDAHGPAGRLGYAELQVSCDNRTDELRLLGNGVVPATAERAFRVLIGELLK